MSPDPAPSVQRLAHALVEGTGAGGMVAELEAWIAASSRFRAFAEANRDKIHRKLRGAADAEARRDVRAELRTASLLLADRRIELAFEAYGSQKRGPDFTVAFRGERDFNLEVTRVRGDPATAHFGAILLAKLLQLPPGVPNALVVAIEGGAADAFDVAAVAQGLRSRADRKEEAFFAERGFDDTRGFYDRFLRLGAVLPWCEGAEGGARATLWANRSARIPLPERAARACLACLRAG